MDSIKLCPPAMVFASFSVAWIIYSFFTLNFFSVVYAIFVGIAGSAALEFLCSNLNPIVSWVLLSLPLIYITVVAAMFGYTGQVALLKTKIMPGCQGDFCMKGRVY